jgi:hypothetical protein
MIRIRLDGPDTKVGHTRRQGHRMKLANFCYWHKADMPPHLVNVCFWGEADIVSTSCNVCL